MTMVERMARAIYDADTHGMNKMSNHTASDMTAAARAVLSALREPTEVMIFCGVADLYKNPDDPEAEVIQVWQAMIDAALNEKGDDPVLDGSYGRTYRRLRQAGILSIVAGAAYSAPMLWAERWPMDTANASWRLASASRSFDLLVNSRWRLKESLPNSTSPPTPTVTKMVNMTGPQCPQNVSRGGSNHASATSPISPTSKTTANASVQCSQDSTASSSSSSLAFISPFFSRHAGRGGSLRGFWFGLGFSALIIAALFVTESLVK